MGRTKKWTKTLCMELARKYAKDSKSQNDFYTTAGMPEACFYEARNNYPEFAKYIKKYIDDVAEPRINDMAGAFLYKTISKGLEDDASDQDKKNALTAAIFVKKTIGGWKENIEQTNLVKKVTVEFPAA